jgi:hypothetical protein
MNIDVIFEKKPATDFRDIFEINDMESDEISKIQFKIIPCRVE